VLALAWPEKPWLWPGFGWLWLWKNLGQARLEGSGLALAQAMAFDMVKEYYNQSQFTQMPQSSSVY
jgi:hypothetical protein